MSTRQSFITDSISTFSDDVADSDRERARALDRAAVGEGRKQGQGGAQGEEGDVDKKLVLFVTVVSARGLAAVSGGRGGAGGSARDLARDLLAKATTAAAASVPLKDKEKEKEKAGGE
jgi:hypothetical protein